MACYYPIDAWRSKKPNDSGKFPIVFKRSEAQQDEPYKLPCGKCIGCRLQHAQAWGIRCMHEMQSYEQNCFVTLTYNDENLPDDHSLQKEHFRLFIKRLRKQIKPKKIRYFACGEYGTSQDPTNPNTLGRPHYHAIIFNHDFEDKELFKVIRNNDLYTSESLSKLWKKGFATVQEANFSTAQYTAGYVVKKIGGDMAETHYQRINPETGEITPLQPEFMACSTGTKETKGLGYRWCKKYLSDLDKGFITINGTKVPYPKYYDEVYKTLDIDQAAINGRNKSNRVDIYNPDFTLDRLRIKETLKLRKTQKLTERNL